MFQQLRPSIDVNYDGRVRLVAREGDRIHGYRTGEDENVHIHVEIVRDLVKEQDVDLSADQAAVLGIAE